MHDDNIVGIYAEQIISFCELCFNNAITEVIGYLANKSTNIEKAITHRFSYDQLEEALDVASSVEAQAVKVIIEY